MSVVENRNNKWRIAYPLMEIMYRIIKFFPDSVVKRFLESRRFKTGWINMAWRYVCLKRLGVNFQGVYGYRIIQSNVCIYNPDKLTIGERVTVNDNSYLECKGGIKIGNDVMIGHGVSILSNSHGYSRTDIPMNLQEEKLKEICIGNNVWIGAKATILMGVTIGDNVIIGAHALVNKDIPDNTIIGGIPARIIRYRNSEQ